MRRARGDEGAYAVLYAILVTVLIGMGSLVVDLSMLRADKRDNRAAADFASLSGAAELGPGPYSPLAACEKAWAYALASLGTTVPASPCSSTAGWVDGVTSCPDAPLAAATAATSNVRITIRWPIPDDDPALLNPDGLEDGGSRSFSSDFDGTEAGCDRIAVDIERSRPFGLAPVLGFSEGSSSSRSVARFTQKEGSIIQISALNLLETSECRALVTVGTGSVLVGPVMKNGAVVGPGSIAVESTGAHSSCTNGENKFVIDPSASGAIVCAAATPISASNPCDGDGVIRSHAMDSSLTAARAWNPATTVLPTPIPMGSPYSYSPVTNTYGCNTSRLGCTSPAPPFAVPSPNYIKLLEDALGGSGTPTPYTGTADPYDTTTDDDPYVVVPATVCTPEGATVSITGPPIVLPPGNWYAPCRISIANGGALIIQGGTLVADGVDVSNGGCFTMNTAVSVCPTFGTGAGPALTTATPPVRDAIVFLRGGSINNQGSLVMPATFVYSKPGNGNNAPNALIVNNTSGTPFTLWTAPGGGPKDPVTKRTMLEQLCFDVTADAVNQDCMDSRFSRLAYWSDYAAIPTGNPGPNNFAGQGALNVVGVFFTPRAFFTFAGGSCYSAASAQFWADKISVVGGSCLTLSPEEDLSLGPPVNGVSLIR